MPFSPVAPDIRYNYLTNARPWASGSLAGFVYSSELASLGINEEDQKLLHIVRACKDMSVDGLDNGDPKRVHPAMISDPVARAEAAVLVNKLQADMVSISTRHQTQTEQLV